MTGYPKVVPAALHVGCPMSNVRRCTTKQDKIAATNIVRKTNTGLFIRQYNGTPRKALLKSQQLHSNASWRIFSFPV